MLFSSPEPLGSHGELIVYQSSVRPPFSKIFSSETPWPIKATFYVEPPLEGRTKVYINGLGYIKMKICLYNVGHMAGLFPCPFMLKNLKTFHHWNQRTDLHELRYVAQGTLAHYLLFTL